MSSYLLLGLHPPQPSSQFLFHASVILQLHSANYTIPQSMAATQTGSGAEPMGQKKKKRRGGGHLVLLLSRLQSELFWI